MILTCSPEPAGEGKTATKPTTNDSMHLMYPRITSIQRWLSLFMIPSRFFLVFFRDFLIAMASSGVWSASLKVSSLLVRGPERNLLWLASDRFSRSVLHSAAVVGWAAIRRVPLVAALEYDRLVAVMKWTREQILPTGHFLLG